MFANNNIFSVSDAAAMLKQVVESSFPNIKIRGELSQITKAASGHIYMTIKDAGASISAIIWRGTPLTFKLEEGAEVIVTGKFTTYPARSNYQIIVNEIEMAGMGAILKMLEQRKQKLAAEGLFDESRKKALPYLPQRIGIVTSPTGAAFQDIQNRLKERFPVEVLLYPATVQGNTAASEVTAGIEYFNKHKNVDVIIVARGGGSLEDLLPFSEESVVRAAANSVIPLISGVGHEPDFMLIDFAADKRAATPTMAAEIVVPTKLSLIQDIQNQTHRLNTVFANKIVNFKQHITSINIKSPKQIIMEQTQRLDDITKTMNLIAGNKLAFTKQLLSGLPNIYNFVKNRTLSLTQAVNHTGQMLSSLGYKSVLQRGFAIVRNSNGEIINRASNFTDTAVIEFADDTVSVKKA